MTVESNYAIAIATLSDWFKCRASFSTSEKKSQNQSQLARAIFPALWASYTEMLRIWVGSLFCLHLQ